MTNQQTAFSPATGTWAAEEEPMILDRITVEPAKMNGQPCIRGMRITVRRVLLELVTYGTSEELIRAHPSLEKEDIRQALLYAAANVSDRIEELMPAVVIR